MYNSTNETGKYYKKKQSTQTDITNLLSKNIWKILSFNIIRQYMYNIIIK